ncbi:cysteine hydrolase family protein [Candidatus Thiodictyon syntrophicum]|jgi:nicotinamidase-related amidase|uniref:Cysteine hydrolase n=1 Tax=Candidatus Thiodictyon syntrophicum TaxID=1166950 RepID=A0A2K8UC47_9GAMM|nr:isochorismatase family cysteine hydrolase [Candidatus Thiodictyon syntrophicum]AUB83115.1 cysteine hydrolase [Candidatus Thiodictyon syntrophicum]
MPTLNANPFGYEFDIDHIALLCIDMQRDFCLPGGFAESLGNDVSLIAPCIPVIAKLQAAFRKAGLPVIHTKECHKPDLSDLPTAKRNRGNPKLKIGDMGPLGRILIDGEPGSEFVDDCKPLEGELVISKPGKDSFYRTGLRDYLVTRGITNLVITGATTDVCVQTTMRCANDRGYDCLLIEDGTESYFPEFKAFTLKALTAQGGIVGWTCKAEPVLDLLARL